MVGEHADIKSSYENVTSKYDQLKQENLNTKTSYAEMFEVNESLEKDYDDLRLDYNDLVDKYINHSDSITDIEKAEAEILVNMIRDTFPHATDEDIVDIANSFSESGCMYIAVANAFASYVSNMENGEQFFKDNFGFDFFVVEF